MEPQNLDTSRAVKGPIAAKHKHSITSDLPDIQRVSVTETLEPKFDPATGLATISPEHHKEYMEKGRESEVYKKLKKESGSAIFKQKIEKIAKEEGVHPEHLFDSLRKAGFKRILNKSHGDSETKWSKNGEALHIDTPEGIRQFIQHHKTNIKDAPWQKDRQAFAEAKAALTKTSDQMDGSTDGKIMDPYAANKSKFVDALGQLIEHRSIYDSEHFKGLGATTNGRLKRIIKFFQDKSANKGDIRQAFKTLTSGNENEIIKLLQQISVEPMFDGKYKANKPIQTKVVRISPEGRKLEAELQKSDIGHKGSSRENKIGIYGMKNRNN